jgi:hypothetical protein
MAGGGRGLLRLYSRWRRALGIGIWGEKESAHNLHCFLPVGCNLEYVQICVVSDGRIVPI